MHRQFFPGTWIAVVLGAAVPSQSPLSTVNGTAQPSVLPSNGGVQSGGVVYFDLVVAPSVTDLSITAIDVNTGTLAGQSVDLDVWVGCSHTTWVGNTGPGASWGLVASGSGTSLGVDAMTPVVLATPLVLGPGPHAIALHHRTMTARTTAGTGANEIHTTAELRLVAGGASNVLFDAAPPLSPRVFNGQVHYTFNQGRAPLLLRCASAVAFGDGCRFGATSFYELFPTLAMVNLAGSAATPRAIDVAARGAAGYAVSIGTGAWFTPVGAPLQTNSTPSLAMGDDSISAPIALPVPFPTSHGPQPVVHAGANGFLILGATTLASGGFQPDAADLLHGPPRVCPLWADLHPRRNLATHPQAGIYFDVDPQNPNVGYVTWQQVGEFATTTSGATVLDFQVRLDSSTGDLQLRYGALSIAAGSSTCIVGMSPGGRVPDPGSVALLASLPLLTSGPDSWPLRVRAVGRPLLGATFDVVTDQVSPQAGLGLGLLDVTALRPPQDLAILGMPGCSAHILNPFVASLAVGNADWTYQLTFPNQASWIGVPVFLQSVSFLLPPLPNAAGVVTSNGVELTPGIH